MSEWISVEDMLPDYGVAVLTIGKHPGGEWTTPVTATLYKDSHDGSERFISGFSFIGDRIIKTMVETKPTHWHKMIEPPK